MVKVFIDKEISRSYWGISEKEISDILKAAQPGEEIEISINSPGGEVYEGVAIFNLIREYAKTHEIVVKIIGLAASVASYIAIAARTINKKSKIIIYENSVFLIHNPWNFTFGDYREMAKNADYLERIAGMVGSTYAFISGKTIEDTRRLMDDETYYIGQEIIENGFANELEQINKGEQANEIESDKNSLTISAKLRIEKSIEKMRINSKSDSTKDDLSRAVALIKTVYNPDANSGAPLTDLDKGSLLNPAPSAAAGGVVHFENSNPKQGESMDKEELKKKYPELYAAIFNEGKEAGKTEERERVEAHLKLGEENGAMKVAAKFIREGNQLAENKVQAEYLSAMKNAAMLDMRNSDNPPPISGANGQAADEAAMLTAWNNGLSGKDEKGNKIYE